MNPPAATSVGSGLHQFPPPRDYSSLSIRDLLDAREAYHVHLAHLESVVATSIGRYRIRKGDWYDLHSPAEKCPPDVARPKGPRTLANSVVKPWSWPAVLVFVRKWLERSDFGESPDQMVPRALYLPDGRVVPTCVVLVNENEAATRPSLIPNFPDSYIGGGYLVTTHLQGRDHVGSVGCLVSDGSLIYALTNRHVTGDGGREIHSVFRGRRERVGISESKHLGKKPFGKVYPGWSGTHTFCNLDVGLIRVDDLSRWTAQVMSLGGLDEPVDLSIETITLDLLGCPVRAFGAASGPLRGQIAGLFYRYKSLGGFDYVADILIGPRDDDPDATPTRPGDSGTLWCLEQPHEDPARRDRPRLRPIALQWGGHVVVDPALGTKAALTFALATTLSTVCRELDLDLVRDWNSGLPEYWGDVGHYTIGAKACERVTNAKLLTLMTHNRDRVSYADDDIRPKNLKGLTKAAFVPLADVPDKVWKTPGGPGARGGGENPNHFADMDRPLPTGPDAGKTLLDLCVDPQNIDVQVWQDYYKAVGDRSQGLLPFRVWQIFDEMVASVVARDVPRFVAAAGIVAHYVGDACQPLHISHLHDGDPEVLVADAHGKLVPRGTGVHSAYESDMLNKHAVEMLAGLNAALDNEGARPQVANGREAAIAVVALMRDAFQTIAPEAIIEAYVHDRSTLWDQLGPQTIGLLARGSLCLAMLWESAWKQGGGDQIPAAELGPVDLDTLAAFYLDKTFLPSRSLGKIGLLLH